VLSPIIISSWLLLKWKYITTNTNWCSMVKIWFFVLLFGAFLSQKDVSIGIYKISWFFTLLFAESNYQNKVLLLVESSLSNQKLKVSSLMSHYFWLLQSYYLSFLSDGCILMPERKCFPTIWMWWIQLSNQFAFGYGSLWIDTVFSIAKAKLLVMTNLLIILYFFIHPCE